MTWNAFVWLRIATSDRPSRPRQWLFCCRKMGVGVTLSLAKEPKTLLRVVKWWEVCHLCSETCIDIKILIKSGTD